MEEKSNYKLAIRTFIETIVLGLHINRSNTYSTCEIMPDQQTANDIKREMELKYRTIKIQLTRIEPLDKNNKNTKVAVDWEFILRD